MLVSPGVGPNSARNDVTDRLEITDVEVLIVRGRRTTPVFLLREIKTGETGKTTTPTVAARIHSEDDIVVVFKERDTVAESEGSVPPT